MKIVGLEVPECPEVEFRPDPEALNALPRTRTVKAVAVSILGADSHIIDQYYTHIGEAARERAIHLISGTGKSLKARVDDALRILEDIKPKSRQVEEAIATLRGQHNPKS